MGGGFCIQVMQARVQRKIRFSARRWVGR